MTEVEELRAATREAHEAMKDLRILMRECREVMAEMHVVAAREVNVQVHAVVQAGLAAHEQAILDAIKEAETMIYRRFSRLGDVLLGEDRSSRAKGNAIQELAAQWAAEER